MLNTRFMPWSCLCKTRNMFIFHTGKKKKQNKEYTLKCPQWLWWEGRMKFYQHVLIFFLMMLLLGAEGGIYRTRSILGVISLYLLKNLMGKMRNRYLSMDIWMDNGSKNGYLLNDNPITQNTTLWLPYQGRWLWEPNILKSCNSSQVWFPLYSRHSWADQLDAQTVNLLEAIFSFTTDQRSRKRNPEKFSSDSDLYKI